MEGLPHPCRLLSEGRRNRLLARVPRSRAAQAYQRFTVLKRRAAGLRAQCRRSPVSRGTVGQRVSAAVALTVFEAGEAGGLPADDRSTVVPGGARRGVSEASAALASDPLLVPSRDV